MNSPSLARPFLRRHLSSLLDRGASQGAGLHLLDADSDVEPSVGQHSALRIQVCSDAAPERNGVGTYYADLCQQLNLSGFQTRFMCPPSSRDSDGWITLSVPGDRTQRLPLPGRPVRRRARRWRPDVIVIATPGPFGAYGLLLARQVGADVVFGYHTHFDGISEVYSSACYAPAIRAAWRLLHRLVLPHCTSTVTNSEHMSAVARRLGARRVHSVGTLVARSFLQLPTSLPEGLNRVVFAGRLAPEKNLPAIIEAAAAVPEVEFRIIGDGALAGLVSEAARALDNLRFDRWQPRQEVRRALDEADMLLLPSHVEAFGTAALESLVRGRPALVSRACGITDWPRLARGLFVMGEGETVTHAIRRVRRLRPALWRAKAAAGRAAAAAMHDHALRDWTHVLEEVATLRTARGEPLLASNPPRTSWGALAWRP